MSRILTDPQVIKSQFPKIVAKEDRQAPRRLTRYEKTSIIGERIEQIAHGAPSFLDEVDFKSCQSAKEVVYKEFEQDRIPFILERKMPDNTIEHWTISELRHK